MKSVNVPTSSACQLSFWFHVGRALPRAHVPGEDLILELIAPIYVHIGLISLRGKSKPSIQTLLLQCLFFCVWN